MSRTGRSLAVIGVLSASFGSARLAMCLSAGEPPSDGSVLTLATGSAALATAGTIRGVTVWSRRRP